VEGWWKKFWTCLRVAASAKAGRNRLTSNPEERYPIQILSQGITLVKRTSGDPHFQNFWNHPFAPSPPLWSPTGKPVVPKYGTHLRHRGRSNSLQEHQGFGGSSAEQRNPPKLDRSVAESVSLRSFAFLHGQGRGLLRRRMKQSRRDGVVLLYFFCSTSSDFFENVQVVR
jgi:hypothetical protein